MKRPTEDITVEQYRALAQRKRQKRAPKADIPRAGPAARTGLSTMLKAGWAWTHNPLLGFRLDKGELSSGWHPDERSAVEAARAVERGEVARC